MTNWYGTNEIDQNDGLTAVYLGEKHIMQNIYSLVEINGAE